MVRPLSLLFIVGSLAARGAEISDVIVGFGGRSAKPVCVSWPSPPRGIPAGLAAGGIYSFLDPARGIRALASLASTGPAGPRPRPGPVGLAAFDWAAHVPAGAGPRVASEDRCHRLLAAAGLPVAAGRLVGHPADAVAAAQALGFPVVLKGISPMVTHRAEAGLLAVDVRDGEEAAAVCRRLQERARQLGITLDGVYVQTMHGGGTELLLAAFRDPIFGVMVSCGSGGGLTELIDDVVIARAPLDPARAVSLLARLRIRRFALDSDGPLPVEPVADVLARFSELASTAPWARFVLEVNPLKWTRTGTVAVDGLLIIEDD